ncbi:unnamed protein product [Phytophthora fragariaefolia]|uniref:Unnamed protein product n=1 Tax=Phytophthora fragariaefolia TaxID=1490495 RepID=A0A9W6XDG0_9STRA|nr:unnamed protein product [Phytophthora fragariaefolia]
MTGGGKTSFSLVTLYALDPGCQRILQQSNESPSNENMYSLDNGQIVVRDGRGQRILLPRDDKLMLDILVQYHDEATVAHPGVVRTRQVLQKWLEFVFDNIAVIHGASRSTVSDRDPKFVSKFWQAVMANLHVKLRMTVSHRAQAGGQSERQIRTFEDALHCTASHYGDNWSEWLTSIEYAHASLVNVPTGKTPMTTKVIEFTLSLRCYRSGDAKDACST